jgi:hypothetical protein
MTARNSKSRKRKAIHSKRTRSRRSKENHANNKLLPPSSAFQVKPSRTQCTMPNYAAVGETIAAKPMALVIVGFNVQVICVGNKNWTQLRAIDKSMRVHVWVRNACVTSTRHAKKRTFFFSLHIPRFWSRNYEVENAVEEILQQRNRAQFTQPIVIPSGTGCSVLCTIHPQKSAELKKAVTYENNAALIVVQSVTEPKAESAVPVNKQHPHFANATRHVSQASQVSPGVMHPVDPLLPTNVATRKNEMESPEYAADIYDYWFATEARRAPSASYMSMQTDINARMREIMVDWMCTVRYHFRFKHETFYLSVHLMDRLLERRCVSRKHMQLVGCAAMFVACKYEEVYAPDAMDFVSVSDKLYTCEQIIAMERIMLSTLNFNVTVPLCINFLERYCALAGITQDSKSYACAQYYADLTHQVYKFLAFMPSCIGAAAFYLALHTINETRVSVEHFTAHRYTFQKILACVHLLLRTIRSYEMGTNKYTAATKIYYTSKYFAVASLECRGIRESDLEETQTLRECSSYS